MLETTLRPMKIFAHRGLWLSKEQQNTEGAVRRALENGLDVEIDVQIAAGNFVITHDAPQKGESLPNLDTMLRLLDDFPLATYALHLKRETWHDVLTTTIVDTIAPYLEQVFLFDISLAYGAILKAYNSKVQFGVSVGDKPYHPDFSLLAEALASEVDIVWADEYRHFYSEQLVEQCHAQHKKVYCISPDLASGVGHPRAQQGFATTWRELIRWKADGICTDHPLDLKKLLLEQLNPTKTYANHRSSSW